ncbi:YjbH domain-containing protein [Pseudoalteromonas sp. MMG013]|uniref:YjbH domain-containing protein n=1 Tax=Pseudoalteromonas sp. MMG013 TaxID=2822687 RepID=UPI001FFDE130|nr:YjbH domain-containing protein [Pseudoalteromonas sp. MMG013]
MRKKTNTMIWSCFIASSPAMAAITDNQSFYGYTGLINIPNAYTADFGSLHTQYNNQLEFRQDIVDGHNFTINAGVFDGLEVGGKIASVSIHDNLFHERARGEEQIRDLSFNAKYQLPFIPHNWFSLAIGAQDIGGAANNYKAYYAVATKRLGDFDLTLGAGSTDNLTNRLDGAFAGVQWHATDWLSITAEHDGEAASSGVKVHVPKKWLSNNLAISLAANYYDHKLSEDDIYFGVNLIYQLNKPEHTSYRPVKPAPQMVSITSDSNNPKVNAAALTSQRSQQAENTVRKGKPSLLKSKLVTHNATDSELEQTAMAFKAALLADGFENIHVGYSLSSVHIIIENHVFNQNELDAIGLILGRLQAHFNYPGMDFNLVLQKLEVPQIQISGQLDEYRDFIQSGSAPNLAITNRVNIQHGGLTWVNFGSTNSPYYKPRLTLSPDIVKGVATELGVLDYSLALQAQLEVPVWQGGSFVATGTQGVATSDDFKDNKSFTRFRHKDGLTSLTYKQNWQLSFNIYNQTQIGYYYDFTDYLGFKHQSMWMSEDGRHQISAQLGYFDYQDYDGDKTVYNTSYQYNLSEYDISLSASIGKFFNKDSGYKLSSKFWFGDTSLDVYYLDTKGRFVGIGLTVPLTPRKDYTTPYGVIKGKSNWRERIQTRVGNDANTIAFGLGQLPFNDTSIETELFNQSRLSESYIQHHLPRLREAYKTFNK